jgi:hypothetical protein
MSTKTSDDILLHYGRKGQKWYHHIFSSVRSGTGRRRKANQQNTPHSHKTSKRKKRGPVDELQREREIIELYRNRDKVSTKVLKNKIARIESERKLKELAEAPGKARAEALQKKRQARLKFVGKVISSGIDVYSKIPSSVATRKIDKNNKDAIDKAIKDFKLRQEWVKAFKDVPITMTNFTQSVNIRGVDVYIPETIQNRFMIQHSGRKGMKWGYHIFGDPNRRAFNKAVRGTRSIVRKMDKQVRKKGMAGSDHLAESESIESLMTKRGPYKLNYSSAKHLVAKQSIANIIRNNKLLATRKGNFNGDDVNAVVGAADHLKYGEGKVKKLTSRVGDSARSLNRESKLLFKDVNKLNRDHIKGKVSDKEYNERLKDTVSRQKKNSSARGYDTVDYSGSYMNEAHRKVYKKGLRKENIYDAYNSALGGGVMGAVLGVNATVPTTGGNPAAIAVGTSVGSTVGGLSGLASSIRNNRRNQQKAGRVLLDDAVTAKYKNDHIDPNVSKSVTSTINTHEFTEFKVKDRGRETVSGVIKKYDRPYITPSQKRIYGLVASEKTKNFVTHSAVSGEVNDDFMNRGIKKNMNHSVTGGTLNGVYIPSNEEVLLQYGKKGMKWKKRKGLPVAGAVRDAMDEAEYRSNVADNNERTNSIQRDIGTIKNKMAQSLGAIKSEVRNGKTKNPKEQRYLDKYRSLVKEYNEAYKRLDEARGSRKRVEEKRSTQKKYKK